VVVVSGSSTEVGEISLVVEENGNSMVSECELVVVVTCKHRLE
jgi:hypothetical protein